MSPAEILNKPVSGRFLPKVTAYVLTDSEQNISKQESVSYIQAIFLLTRQLCFFVLPRMLMLRSVLWVKKRNQLTFQYRTINVEFYAKQALHACCLSCFAELLSLSFRNFFNNVNLCYHSQIFQVQKTFMSSATVFYSVTMYRTKDVVL